MALIANRISVRILHLEDESDYSALVRAMLEAEGYQVDLVCAASKGEFLERVEEGEYDLIIADYMLPDYDGFSALKVVRESNIETPFLLVSGTIGEEAAIRSLKAGASDYVLKNWPERLIPAVERALRESDERKKRRQAESTLASRDKYFRALSENALDIVSILDLEGAYQYNSPSIERTLGYTPAELQGRVAFDFVHPEDLDRVLGHFQRALAEPEITQTLELRFRHKNGTWRWLEVVGQNMIAVPEIHGVVINTRDVTERREVEERNSAFARIGQRLSSAATPLEAARIITDAADQMFGWDACAFDLCSPDHSCVEAILAIDTVDGERRDVTSQIMNHPPSERALRVIHEGPQLILREDLSNIPDGGRMFGDANRPSASIMSAPIRNADCVIGLLSIHSYRIRAYQKQDLVLLEAMADNCGAALQRIRVQEALRESEQRFKAVWENSVDGMRLTDSKGAIVAVNPAYCRLVGMGEQELVGRHFTEVYADDVPPEKRDTEYRLRFENRMALGHLRRRLKYRTGRSLELDITSSFIEVPGGDSYVLSLFRDVTEQSNLEDQLRHSQKMDAIGQLAGGVAHDFNNILTVIQGHASLIRSNPKLPQELSASVEQIATVSERAGELTRQLLTFSRRQIIRRKRCDLNDSVRQISSMLERILGEDIVLEVHTSEQPAVVEADAGMMEQVIMNLSVNARDAMPRGGFLRISTERSEITKAYTRLRPDARPGSFVQLSIQDTGEGISEANLLRIFEPFFTTKETGKGTGLGLPTVYGIVKLHEGWIEVTSEVDAGTTFKVFLPLSSSPVAPAEDQVVKPHEQVAGGNETILLAEDETAVRNLVHKVLARHGYQVLAAECGQQALELWRENKDKIHLLLTDIIMPGGMNGRELAEKILAEKPSLKVLYSSGYSADVAGRDFVLEDGVNFLPKPYHPRRLTSAIRECLDRQPA